MILAINPAPSLRAVVVCMVYNGYEYLSEFINYHLTICDHIYLIDHHSDRDLRALNHKNVTCIRSEHVAQFQSECTNLVIQHYKLKDQYDWLFVLDIDEFLPFQNKNDFHEYLAKMSESIVVQFHWHNGVPFYDDTKEFPQSLIDCRVIKFFSKRSVNYKACINLRKIGQNFVVPTGAHRIDGMYYSFLSRRPLGRRYKTFTPIISEYPLHHILAFNKNSFVSKIRNYVEQMKYRENVRGQGGWVVRDYPDHYSDEEWLWYVANFRVTDPSQYYDVRLDDFIAENIFTQVDRQCVLDLINRIHALPKVDKQDVGRAEEMYLEYKKDDGDVIGNLRWFRISRCDEIISVVPKNLVLNLWRYFFFAQKAT